jgi:hypothetical protein
MRYLQRTSLALTMTIAVAPPAFATEMDHGDMVAAIRSADYPCQRVLELQDTGSNTWLVLCNSGTYQVTLDASGNYSVVKTD